jgi:AAA domain
MVTNRSITTWRYLAASLGRTVTGQFELPPKASVKEATRKAAHKAASIAISMDLPWDPFRQSILVQKLPPQKPVRTIDTYEKESHLRVLLQGPPGAGKTTLACHFPAPYIADLDINLGGPLRWLRENRGPLPVGYDIIGRSDDGKEVPARDCFRRLITCLGAAVEHPKVETIVIDSATRLGDYIQAEVLRTQGKSEMTLHLWGFYLAQWKQLISQLTAQRKHLVLTCHETVEKDEIDQSLRYFVQVAGQMKFIIGSMFTDVWRCEVAATAGPSPKHTFQVRTMPDYRYALKNSLSLPPVFKFDWALIEARLNNTSYVA